MIDRIPGAADPLLEPFDLAGLHLRNRVFSSSHSPGYNVDGTPSDRYVRYHEEKALGGIGMTMIGGSSNVSVDSASLWGQLSFATDAIVDPLATMVDRIHGHGAAIICQLTHMGRRNVSNDGDWLPTIAPSSVREPMHRFWPKKAEPADLRRVVDDFAAATRRAADAGLDGIELVATSHLLDQFWSPLVNRRTDGYGGSLDNRLRLTIEVLEAVRQAVDGRLLVGLRMLGTEDQVGGLDEEDCCTIAVRLAGSGLLDFLNVAGPALATEEGLSRAIPPAGTPLAPYLPVAAAVRSATNLPLLHATRIIDPATARHALETGAVDLVGMTRAHFADPHLVAKLERGEPERIRTCVGASLCINRLHLGLDSVCIQNPSTGREGTVPQLVVRSTGPRRQVVVVGGGPGGLEAARTAVERGHSVVLFEAQDRLGGQLALMARAGERQREVASLLDWLVNEVALAGVDVRLSTPVEASDVLDEAPDVVIVATGGSPEVSYLETGAHLVCTAWDVLGGSVRPEGRVLVYDDHGAERGLAVVEFLVERADPLGVSAIEVVTPDRHVGLDLATPLGPAYLRMLYEGGVTMTADHRLVAVESRDDGSLQAVMRNEYSRREANRTVDAVIVEHGVAPDEKLYETLRDASANRGAVDLDALSGGRAQPAFTGPDGGYLLYRVGDCVASRDVASALLDARRLLQHL
ncbi:MAG: FAD-dependent oxidoreductase [Actinomycetota bacterium]|nr:FAD-dependent oxidoreductase [Actinomycetota bacterium]MED5231984.1 FAD-dependent oxidoreductase [Actinomycetota bacterium]MEE3354645.1 FAD-dependent oxidoreductase [Actinomycetota bacterium]